MIIISNEACQKVMNDLPSLTFLPYLIFFLSYLHYAATWHFHLHCQSRTLLKVEAWRKLSSGPTISHPTLPLCHCLHPTLQRVPSPKWIAWIIFSACPSGANSIFDCSLLLTSIYSHYYDTALVNGRWSDTLFIYCTLL